MLALWRNSRMWLLFAIALVLFGCASGPRPVESLWAERLYRTGDIDFRADLGWKLMTNPHGQTFVTPIFTSKRASGLSFVIPPGWLYDTKQHLLLDPHKLNMYKPMLDSNGHPLIVVTTTIDEDLAIFGVLAKGQSLQEFISKRRKIYEPSERSDRVYEALRSYGWAKLQEVIAASGCWEKPVDLEEK